MASASLFLFIVYRTFHTLTECFMQIHSHSLLPPLPTLCPTKSHLMLPMWLRSRTAHWRRSSFSGASSLEKTFSLQLNRHSITGIFIIIPTEECTSQPSLEEFLVVVNGDQCRTLQLINMQRIIDYGVFTSK